MSQPPYDPNNPHGQQQPPYGQQQGWQGAPSTDPFGKPAIYSGVGYNPPPPPRSRPTCLILLIVALACGLPLLIIGGTVLIAGGALAGTNSILGDMGLGDISAFVSTAVDAMRGPETVAIQGDASRFDPQAGLDQAAAFAGTGAQFAGLNAANVRSDGTMDLTATYSPGPRVSYSFLRPIEPPANAPPLGAAGNTGGQWYEPITIEAYRPGQTSRITTTGGGLSTSIQFTNQGMRKDISSPTTNPFDSVAPPMRCAFVDLWNEAIERGAPEDAVATIRYNEFGDDWTYDFVVPGTSLTFNADCTVDE
ncbi:MAG: hypothetical protein IAE89_15190 [Anaerolineae bacterium]|nr:hypothetical protein [Anaerolineae bacterium]